MILNHLNETHDAKYSFSRLISQKQLIEAVIMRNAISHKTRPGILIIQFPHFRYFTDMLLMKCM